MDDVFRFMTIRPAEDASLKPVVTLAADTLFQERIRAARANEKPWPAMVEGASAFIDRDPAFLANLAGIPLRTGFDALYAWIDTSGATARLAAVIAAIAASFGKSPEKVSTDPDFVTLTSAVKDTILAIYIVPAKHHRLLPALLQLARAIALIERAARKDPALDVAGAVPAAARATLLLPGDIFPVRTDQILPVGIADLHVVKQHILRYDTGEIASIENVLSGESRAHTVKHGLTTVRTTETETEVTKETTNELSTTDRFDLKTEIARTLKEDVSLKTGVSVTAMYGKAVQMKANLDVAYMNSKSEATKTSTDHAREVTARATSKVTDRIRQKQASTITEMLEDTEVHTVDNTMGGGKHVVGVYQWIDKVYQMQVFNYGKRLLFDVTVPEPAALLRDAATTKDAAETKQLVEPLPLQITPYQLSTDPNDKNFYYGIFVQRYGAGGVDGPPPPTRTATTKFTGTSPEPGDKDKGNIAVGDTVAIEAGYRAKKIAVRAIFNRKGGTDPKDDSNSPRMYVLVGHRVLGNDKVDREWEQSIVKDVLLDPTGEDKDLIESQSIPVALEATKVLDYGVTVEVHCELQPEALERWKIATYGAILKAYQQRVADYEDKLAATAFQKKRGAQATLGGNPENNRRIERIELKRSFIMMLTGRDLVLNGIDDMRVEKGEQAFPRPDVASGARLRDDGAYVRFFEQAFEWEQITYVFYPYYWGRKDTWYEELLLENDDPAFADFLRAGSARVVVPVRPSFEGDLDYFLMTGQIWGGSDVPAVTDERYVPIVEEIKEATSAPSTETPVGDVWEARVPTQLVKLRKDDTLPAWKLAKPPAWRWEEA